MGNILPFIQIIWPSSQGISVRLTKYLVFLFIFSSQICISNDSTLYLQNQAIYLTNKGNLDDALIEYQKIEAALKEHNNDSLLIFCWLAVSDIYVQKRNFLKSEEYLSKSQELLYSLKHLNKYFPDYLQSKGNYFLSFGKMDSAELYLRKSIQNRLLENNKLDYKFSYSFNKLGNYYLIIGIYDSALHYYQKAINATELNESNSFYDISSYFQNLAIIYSIKGDYTNAENYFLKSLKIKQNYFDEQDVALAKIYINMGRFYSSLSKFDSAFKYYDKAEILYSKDIAKYSFDIAPIYWNKGNLFFYSGDYEKSIIYLSKAYNIYSSQFEQNHPKILELSMDIGSAFEKKNDFKNAIIYYNKSIANQESPVVVKSYRNLGNIYIKLGDLNKAESFYKSALYYASMFYGDNSYDYSLCLLYYGEFLLKNRKNFQGINLLTNSITILTEIFGNKHRDISKAYLIIGEYYFNTFDYTNALIAFQKSLISLFPKFNSLNYLDNPSYETYYNDLLTPSILYQKAKCLYYLSNYESKDTIILESSKKTLESTVNLIDKLRNSYTDEDSKLLLTNASRDAFDLGMQITSVLYDKTNDLKYLKKCFEYSEKSKSAILISTLRGLDALQISEIPQELKLKEKQINKDLLFYNGLIYDENLKSKPDNSKIVLWENQIFNLKLQYDSLLSSLEEMYPIYFQLKYDNSVINSDSICNLLDSNQIVLAYSNLDTLLFTFVISKNEFILYKSKKEDYFDKNLSFLLQNFKQSSLINLSQKDFESFVNVSHSIYLSLFGHLLELIHEKRLVIIPDAELGYLSFDLLLTRPPSNEEMNFRTLPYLIKEHPISYSSSATLYYEALHKTGPAASRSLLAFAPKYDELSRTRSAPNDSLAKAIQTLLPIPGVEEEINNIARMFRGKKYRGMRATESVFKEKAEDYNILHLAMHTIIDDKNPMFSKLVFTPEEGRDDGFLNTYELFNLELKGSLAVLSACNTGSGKLEKGEGIISLARGFIYAGIPSIVMTLWEVEDYSSADLMTGFYDYLEKGLSKDVALQKAKIDYLQKADALKSHPYFWAGFVSIGDPEPLDTPRSRLMLWLIPALAFILLSIFFINRQVYFRKRKINP